MYRICAPAPPLRPYIDCYWFARIPGGQLDEQIFVDGKADILFNFGCAYERSPVGTQRAPDHIVRSNLDAQRKYPVIIRQQGDIHLASVRFWPGGLAAFLACP